MQSPSLPRCFEERRDGGSLGSINAYYYTPVRGMFAGALLGIGVCLVCIRGSTTVEDVLLNAAGMLAPVVALIPTPPDERLPTEANQGRVANRGPTRAPCRPGQAAGRRARPAAARSTGRDHRPGRPSPGRVRGRISVGRRCHQVRRQRPAVAVKRAEQALGHWNTVGQLRRQRARDAVASGVVSTLVEWLGASSPDASWPRVLQVHPAVLDTSALVSDLFGRVREPTTPLLAAMHVGVVRGFAAQHVWAEVPRKIAEIGATGRLNAVAAEQAWWEDYVPLIRFVDASMLPDTPHHAALATRDASDGPTERLRALLAPIVVLAEDHDLIKLKLASEQWRPLARAGADVAVAGGSTVAASGTVVAIGYGGARLTAGTVRLLRQRPTVALTAGAALLIAAMTRRSWYAHIGRRLSVVGRSARAAGASAVELIGECVPRIEAAFDAWDREQVGEPGDTLAHRAARTLAASPVPLSRTTLAVELAARHGGSERQLAAELRHVVEWCSAFVAVGQHWQIGRTCVDFNRASEEANISMPDPQLGTSTLPGDGGSGLSVRQRR